MRNKTLSKLLLIAAAWSAVPSGLRADEQSIPSDIPQLIQMLNSSSSSQGQKDNAAEKLSTRSADEASQALRDALKNIATTGVQSAAAKALVVNPSNDPQFINLLFGVLEGAGNKQSTLDSAALALSAYKTDPSVTTRLIGKAKDKNLDEKVRLACIRSLGRFVDQSAAKTLVELSSQYGNSVAIYLAAQDSLSYMTGIATDTSNDEFWSTWGKRVEKLSPATFMTEIYTTRASKYDQIQRQLVDLQKDVSEELQKQYQTTAVKDREDLLVQFLKSDQFYFRFVGAELAQQEAIGKGATARIKQELRNLLSDPSPKVREQVANAIAVINDQDALMPLLTQLNQETDSTVLIALVHALAPIEDNSKVPVLLKMLDDKNQNIIVAAAVALSDKKQGEKLRKENSQLADKVADKLIALLQNKMTANDDSLRKSVSKALIPLAYQRIVPEILVLIQRENEIPQTKKNLLLAIETLHLSQTEDVVGERMKYDPDVGVRITAMQVYGKIAQTFNVYGGYLFTVIYDEKEPAEIRQQAWTSMLDLFKVATDPELGLYSTKLNEKGDYQRRLAVLRIMADRYKNAGNKQSDEWKNFQDIGDTAMKAGTKYADPQYYPIAIEAYNKALAGASKDNAENNIEQVVHGLTSAYLKAHQYRDCISFLENQIKKDPAYRELGDTIRQEIEMLIDESRDYESALQLIDVALKMNPPLSTTVVEILNQKRQVAEDRKNQRNLRPSMIELPISAQLFGY